MWLQASALISFSCKDEAHLNSGEPLAPALVAIEDCTQIIAVGVNCTPPHLIAPLLTTAAAATAKPFVACAHTQTHSRSKPPPAVCLLALADGVLVLTDGNSGEEFTSAGATAVEEGEAAAGWSGKGSGREPADYACSNSNLNLKMRSVARASNQWALVIF